MNNGKKKALKIIGITAGTLTTGAILCAAFIGGGEICNGMYYDSGHWYKTIFQHAMLGYDHIFNLGWAA